MTARPDPEAVALDRYGAAIRATAALHPLEQVDALVSLFGASADDAPAFAAFLIGELVVTRLRLADLRRIHAPAEASS